MTRRDATWAALVTALVLALYVATLRPDVGGTEDSPKFQLVGRVLGTAHSPGYPLYVVLTHAFGRLPIGTLAYRINLFSALCGALACACAFGIARRLGATRLIAAAAALAAGTTAGLWRNAVIAEVYSLAALMASLTVLLLLAWGNAGKRSRLYAACAAFAAGLGNHLTIAGMLPAALAYGIARDRSVLRPRIVATAAAIGLAGVLQYGFIALRTVQRAPYLEARATTVRGVADVMMARDQSWARFQYGPSDLVSVQFPRVAGVLVDEMGVVAIVLALAAVALAVIRRRAAVLMVAGAAAGMLALVINLSGDVSGFLTPVVILIWPLAAAGVHAITTELALTRTAMTLLGLLALATPVSMAAVNRHAVAPLRDTEDVRGIRAMYARLISDATIVADNYWTARVLDYLHFSGEYAPDPNPIVVGKEAGPVRDALGQGRAVFAFEGTLPWLTSQELRYAATDLTSQPLGSWLQRQPAGTRVIVAAAGRALPFEWFSRDLAQGRPAVYGAALWTIGEGSARVEQSDLRAVIQQPMGAERRAIEIATSDDGVTVMWGEDVLSAMDHGLTVVAISPRDEVIGRWAFDVAEKLEMVLPPAVYAVTGEGRIETLPALPATGQLDVGVSNNALYGAGWYLPERAGAQRFRWSQRSSVMAWSMDAPADLRFLLRLRAAAREGTTITATINGAAAGSCALPAGVWSDCRIDIPAAAVKSGANSLTLTAASAMASEDRRNDPRELAFSMQESRVRVSRR